MIKPTKQAIDRLTAILCMQRHRIVSIDTIQSAVGWQQGAISISDRNPFTIGQRNNDPVETPLDLGVRYEI